MRKKWFLQMFAEDGDGAGSEGGTDNNEGSKGNDEGKGSEKTFTESEVNKLIDDVVAKKFAKWTKDTENKISEAEKLAKMSESEKSAHERKKLEDELEAYKQREARAELKKEARGILTEKNIQISEELLDMLVGTDAESTQKAITDFTSLFKAEVDKAVQDALKKKPPKTGSDGAGLTKADIMKIKNPAERQKLIAENIHLWK